MAALVDAIPDAFELAGVFTLLKVLRVALLNHAYDAVVIHIEEAFETLLVQDVRQRNSCEAQSLHVGDDKGEREEETVLVSHQIVRFFNINELFAESLDQFGEAFEEISCQIRGVRVLEALEVVIFLRALLGELLLVSAEFVALLLDVAEQDDAHELVGVVWKLALLFSSSLDALFLSHESLDHVEAFGRLVLSSVALSVARKHIGRWPGNVTHVQGLHSLEV